MTHPESGLEDLTCKECDLLKKRVQDRDDAYESLLDYYRTRVDVLEEEIKRLKSLNEQKGGRK